MTDVLSIEQVAELLDCSIDTVAERTVKRELPAVKFGRSYRYPREALIRRLNELAQRDPEPAPKPRAVVVQRQRKPPPLLPV